MPTFQLGEEGVCLLHGCSFPTVQCCLRPDFKYSRVYCMMCARPHLWRSLPPICRLFLVPSCLGGGLNRFNALVTVSPERRCSSSTHFRVAGPEPLILSLTDNSPLEVKCAPRKRSSSLRLFAIKPYTGISESYDIRVGNADGDWG